MYARPRCCGGRSGTRFSCAVDTGLEKKLPSKFQAARQGNIPDDDPFGMEHDQTRCSSVYLRKAFFPKLDVPKL